MPSLFIDGDWVASGDGTCSPVVNPSDASIVTEVDVATDAQVQAAIAAARRAFDASDWPRTPDRRAGGAARPCRRPARARRRGARTRGDAQYRQGDAREPRRHRRRDPRLPLLRGSRRQGSGPDRRHRRAGRREPDRPRTDRSLRPDRTVELPAPAAVVEDRAGARGRVHGRHEARPRDAADGDPPDPPPRRGWHAAGRREPRPWPRRAGRAGARRFTGCRPRLPDRWHRGRARVDARCRGEREARRARARWQEPEHRVRRRRSRDGRR